MVRNDIKKSSLLRTKILIYAFNGRTFLIPILPLLVLFLMVRGGIIYTISADIYAQHLVFGGKLHCI